MTAKEMHIGVEQGLQRHNSYVFDDFLPEEIDLVLNKVTKRFIDDKFRKDNVSKGFQPNQGNLDDIQFLIEKDVKLPAFLDFTNDKAYCVLPSNYLYLINNRSKINDNCKLVNFTEVEPFTENYLVYTLKNSENEENPYDEFKIIFNGVTIFDIDKYLISQGLSVNEEKFVIKNLVIDEIRNNLPTGVIGIYWERYRNSYYPDSFIVVTHTNPVNNRIIIDEENIEVELVAVEGLERSVLPALKEVNNRLTKSENFSQVLYDNVFHRTIPRSPVSELSKNFLNVYFNKKFIVNSIVIDYVRNPQNISLYLNRSCELSESVHERIVDLAVEFIKNTIEQPSYDTKVKDNLLRGE